MKPFLIQKRSKWARDGLWGRLGGSKKDSRRLRMNFWRLGSSKRGCGGLKMGFWCILKASSSLKCCVPASGRLGGIGRSLFNTYLEREICFVFFLTPRNALVPLGTA